MLTFWAVELLPVIDLARAALIGSLASTAFVLFLYPHSRQADPRHAIGGHAVAVVSAAPFAVLAGGVAHDGFVDGGSMLFIIYATAALGVAMLVMALTSTEHPPAAGASLALVVHGLHMDLVVFIAVAVLLMSAAHQMLISRMHNL